MTAASPEWRDQTERERELIETILLADFPGRDEIALQLRGAKVGLDCACGCGSFGVLPNEGQPKSPVSGEVFSAHGKDSADALVTLRVVVNSGGFVDFIESTVLSPNDAAGLPLPETLRAYVEVEPDGQVRNFILGERTIIEEARMRGTLP